MNHSFPFSFSAMSAFPTSLFTHHPPHPRFKFHTCQQGSRGEKCGKKKNKKQKKLSSLLLWNKPEGKALEWWVGFAVMTNVFSCPSSSAPQRGGWKGEEIWKSWTVSPPRLGSLIYDFQVGCAPWSRMWRLDQEGNIGQISHPQPFLKPWTLAEWVGGPLWDMHRLCIIPEQTWW